jgi:hypothetical protein
VARCKPLFQQNNERVCKQSAFLRGSTPRVDDCVDLSKREDCVVKLETYRFVPFSESGSVKVEEREYYL